MYNLYKKIGIMGGSFNPPHLGHLISAQISAEKLNLDKVIFIPNGKIAYKANDLSVSLQNKMDMVKLLIQNYPKFEVSDIEIKDKGYSYTYKTLKELKKIYPDAKLYFIVGADSLNYMEKWKNPELIFPNCTIVSVSRNGFSIDAVKKKSNELKKMYDADIELIEMPNIDISSTEIRKQIKKGIYTNKYIDDKVLKYIIDNKLYLSGENCD